MDTNELLGEFSGSGWEGFTAMPFLCEKQTHIILEGFLDMKMCNLRIFL